MQNYDKSLFLFHRDLRLHDNTGLLEALKSSKTVIPAFIFDPRQINDDNPYKSSKLIQFMIESLEDLHADLQTLNTSLYCFYGKTDEVLLEIIKKENIHAFFSNKDYTPFAQNRDKQIEDICNKTHTAFHLFDDALLSPPGSIVKDDKTPYKVYTAFMKKSRENKVPMPQKNTFSHYYSGIIAKSFDIQKIKENIPFHSPENKLRISGGRTQAKELLKEMKKIKNYKEQRNIPAEKGNSLLSAHNKFGTLSIREVYYGSQKYIQDTSFSNELYWRDFFTHIGFHFPAVFTGAFHEKYNALKWENNEKWFEYWQQGKTGFPIVDAGMRELSSTGYMHNRVRMITASFLIKDLHIDWRWGEKYFAQKLIDYDPAVNNGNWQWVAGTGTDAQPYFRIFNPWTQQKKFDPDCEYIKKWIPELKMLSSKDIHGIEKWWEKNEIPLDYPRPIIDHKKESKKAKVMYEKLIY